jgi:hypothetical protein
MRPRSALQGSELLPQGDVLEHEVLVSAAARHNCAYDQEDQFEHAEIVVSVARRNQRMDDG